MGGRTMAKKASSAKSGIDFQTTFEKLKAVMQHATAGSRIIVKIDEPGNYSLDGPYSEKFKKEVFFGAVQIKKNYVSYHLMPVYAFPALLDGISPALKKRMQGKSCFNFTTITDDTVVELGELTEKGREHFAKLL